MTQNSSWLGKRTDPWSDENHQGSTKKEAKADVYKHLTVDEADSVVRGVSALKRKVSSRSYSSGEPLEKPAENKSTRKPLDVFTATAFIQQKIEERKQKPVAHVATAPEAVSEAFTALGITPPDPAQLSVWDCLSSEDGKAYDLDTMRAVMMVSRGGPLRHEPDLRQGPLHQDRDLHRGLYRNLPENLNNIQCLLTKAV